MKSSDDKDFTFPEKVTNCSGYFRELGEKKEEGIKLPIEAKVLTWIHNHLILHDYNPVAVEKG